MLPFQGHKKKPSRNPLLKVPNTNSDVEDSHNTKGTSKTGTDTHNAGLSTKSTKYGIQFLVSAMSH